MQFAEKDGKQYSIRHRGMTAIRKDNIRYGAGGDFQCSDEGAGVLYDMGMKYVV